MPFFVGSAHSAATCLLFGDTEAAADVAAEPLAAAVCPAAIGALDDRAETLATAGLAMPSVINAATATPATTLRRSLGAFRSESNEILQSTRTGGSPSPDGIG
jgi:hypothetical protein